MRLIHRVNEINLEGEYNISNLTITYSGSFVGKVLGNTISSISRDKINIVFLDDAPETIILYSGSIKILKISAISKNNESINGEFIVINDEIQRLKSVWDESTMKWEDYNKSNKYYKPIMSIIEYSENGVIKYQEARGRRLLSLPLKQKTMLNKIRGNYGVK